jgi:hypothetical protein
VEGKTLAQIVDSEGPLPEERALPILLQICDALAHAHLSHIVHRDLKPNNVIVIPPNDHVKLVDFGIARLLPESGEDMQKLTQTGQIMGTFLYMSPEQCMGRQTDARTDLYAFGCLMYKLLTGHTPFESDVPFELMGMHLGVAPPAMAGVSKRLNTIAAWCLRKDPLMRPQTASELKEVLLGRDLEMTLAVQSPEPVAINETNPRKMKVLYTAGGAFVLSLLVAFFVFAFPHLYPKQGEGTDQQVVSNEERRLLDAAAKASASKSVRDIALANMELCKYYNEEQRWKDAEAAGAASVAAFEKLGEMTSPDSLWASYYNAVALQNLGKEFVAGGHFQRLSEDIKNTPQKLKALGALHAAECLAKRRRLFHANIFFKHAIKHSKHPDGDFSVLQQARLEYAQFLRNPPIISYGNQSSHISRPEWNAVSIGLLNDIVKDGAHTPEDALRVETAKQMLAHPELDVRATASQRPEEYEDLPANEPSQLERGP